MHTLRMLAIFAVTACAAVPPEGMPTQSDSPPLIFVHGFKGSELIESDGARRWLTRSQALGLDNTPLALPTHWDADDKQDRDHLRPGNVLEALYVVPYLVGGRVYTPWLQAARQSGFAFYPFSYDWRRDNLENLEALAAFVQQVRAQHHQAKVRLVGHSLGGLLSLALLNRHPEDFEQVAFAGVPFGGGVGFLQDLTVGTKTGLNKRTLSPRVLGTFPSVYAFFPLDGHGLVDASGQAMTVEYYAVDTWTKHRWGLFSGDGAIDEAGVTFIAKALDHAKRFRQMLAPRDVVYPPIKIVLSKHIPTLNVAQVGEHPDLPDFDAQPKVEGDGRVSAVDALPPKPLTYDLRFSREGHSELLNDPAIIEWVLAR
jgi:pimeloyl-ACP methyl ester carboxylesterase